MEKLNAGNALVIKSIDRLERNYVELSGRAAARELNVTHETFQRWYKETWPVKCSLQATQKDFRHQARNVVFTIYLLKKDPQSIFLYI